MLRFIALILLIVSSCTPTAKQSAGSFSAISVQTPNLSDLSPELQAKLTGLRLGISATDCPTFTAISEQAKFGTLSVKKQLKRDCNYSASLELGYYDSAQPALTEVYYSNLESGSGNPQTQIAKDDLKSKDKPQVLVKLHRTDLGERLGFPEKLSLGSGTIPSGGPVSGYDYRSFLQTVDISSSSTYPNSKNSLTHVDVMSHLQGRTQFFTGVGTETHENNHFINSYIRKTYRTSGTGIIGIYMLGGKGAWTNESKILQSDTARYLPDKAVSLTNSKYQTYVVKAAANKDTDTLFDEWNAYINGAKAELDILTAGGNLSEFSGDGVMEFVYFNCGYLQALKAEDAQYLDSNDQFKAMLAFQFEESMKVVQQQLTYSIYTSTPKVYDDFRNNPDNSPCRDLLKTYYGSDWTSRVMSF